jgi:hypothetical protein
MADIKQLEAALIKADAAGNEEDARILAAEIRKMRAAPAGVKQEAPKKEPSTLDKLASVGTSAITGAGSTLLGLIQAGAHSIPELEQELPNGKKMVIGKDAGKNADATMNQLDKFREDLRKKAGLEGMDVSQILGSLVDPLAFKAASKLPVATTKTGQAVTAVGGGGLFGAANPVVGKDFSEGKNEQITTGAAFGAIMKLAGTGASKGAEKVNELLRPFTEKGRARMLYDYLDKLSGTAKADIVKALNNVQEYVPGSKATGGEAIADIPEATALASFLRHLEGVKGDMKEQPVSAMYAKRRAEQEAARLAAVRSVGQDEAALTAAKRARDSITGPMRTDALEQANIGGIKTPELLAAIADKERSKADVLQTWGKTKTTAAQQEGLSKNQYPVPGYPKFPQRYTHQYERVPEFEAAAGDAMQIAKQRQAEKEFRELQLKSLEADGYFPLKSGDLVSTITKTAKAPGTSTLAKKTLDTIKEAIETRTNENGVINAYDLYTVRKEIGNIIETHAKETNAWDKKTAAGIEKNMQSYIDAAIKKAGGEGWEGYLTKFKEMSAPINQMEIGQFLEKKLTSPLDGGERASVFATAVREAPNTIKKASGQSRFKSLEEVLTPEQMAAISGVSKDLERAKKFKDLAAKTHEGDPGELAGKLQAPGLISTAASITNWGLKILRSGAEEKIATLAAKLDQNPRALASFMSNVPKNQVEKVVDALGSKVSPESRKLMLLYASKQAGAATNE